MDQPLEQKTSVVLPYQENIKHPVLNNQLPEESYPEQELGNKMFSERKGILIILIFGTIVAILLFLAIYFWYYVTVPSDKDSDEYKEYQENRIKFSSIWGGSVFLLTGMICLFKLHKLRKKNKNN